MYISIMTYFIVLFLIWGSCETMEQRNFCLDNNQLPLSESNDDNVHFSKELNPSEYGIDGYYKSLYCCAHNYQRIEWSKDGHSYPWLEEVSSFKQNASDAQIMFTRAAVKDDSGWYTCKIFDLFGNVVMRKFHLNVISNGLGYTGMPIATFKPPEVIKMNVTDSARIYCEAFVGKINLPDAKNEIRWFRITPNGSKILISDGEKGGSIHLIKVSKDNGLTLGLLLILDKVEDEDYGNYYCLISNAADQQTHLTITLENASSMRYVYNPRWLIFMLEFASLVLVFACLAFMFLKYNVNLRLCFKQCATHLTANADNDKEYDAFILYELRNEHLATSIVENILKNKYGYSVCSQALEDNIGVNMECQSRIAASASILTILTLPTTPEERNAFSQNVYTASHLHSNVIYILLKTTTNPDSKTFEMPPSFLPGKRLLWDWNTKNKIDAKHWKSLRLVLPVKSKLASRIRRNSYRTVEDRHILFDI